MILYKIVSGFPREYSMFCLTDIPPLGMHAILNTIHFFLLKNTHGLHTCACVSERSSSFCAGELDASAFSPGRTSMPFSHYVDAFRYSRCGATLSRTLEMPPSSRASLTSCPISRKRLPCRSQEPRRFVPPHHLPPTPFCL